MHMRVTMLRLSLIAQLAIYLVAITAMYITSRSGRGGIAAGLAAAPELLLFGLATISSLALITLHVLDIRRGRTSFDKFSIVLILVLILLVALYPQINDWATRNPALYGG